MAEGITEATTADITTRTPLITATAAITAIGTVPIADTAGPLTAPTATDHTIEHPPFTWVGSESAITVITTTTLITTAITAIIRGVVR